MTHEPATAASASASDDATPDLIEIGEQIGALRENFALDRHYGFEPDPAMIAGVARLERLWHACALAELGRGAGTLQ